MLVMSINCSICIVSLFFGVIIFRIYSVIVFPGCEGGFPYLIAGKYAQDFGLVEESCYPYQVNHM